MIVNRIIDNAGVAIAAINRQPVVSARAMALGHSNNDHSKDSRPKSKGATVFGVPSDHRVSPEWAGWRMEPLSANSTCTILFSLRTSPTPV